MKRTPRLPPTSLEDDELEAALIAATRRHHRQRRARMTSYEQAVYEEWARRQGVQALIALQREKEQQRAAGRRRAGDRREARADLLRDLEEVKALNGGYSERVLMKRVLGRQGQRTDKAAVDAALRRVRRIRLEKKRGQ